MDDLAEDAEPDIVINDLSQQAFAPVRADRDEIPSTGGVIVVLQPDRPAMVAERVIPHKTQRSTDAAP